MKNTTKLVIVYHSPQLVFALALCILGIYGLVTFTPTPPELPYTTFMDSFGRPIYLIGTAFGVFFLWRTIRRIRDMLR